MNSKIEFFYDPEADMLEIFIGNSSSPPIFNEISPDIFEGKDQKTHGLRGYKIFNLTKQQNMKKVKVSIPIDIDSL